MNPSANLLDPALHTPQYVAMRSPFLFTISKSPSPIHGLHKLTMIKYVVSLLDSMSLDHIFIDN